MNETGIAGARRERGGSRPGPRGTPVVRAVRSLLVALAALAPCVALAGAEPEGQEKEYQLKAAFLFNFAKFVTWPESAFSGRNAPLVIGVVGPDPFGAALEKTLEGKSIGERRIEVRRFDDARDAKKSHILFIARSNAERLAETIGALEGAPVLTVGEDEEFTLRGGIIRFLTLDNRIRFEANSESARKAGLGLSSQLLKLAVKPDRDK